MGETNVAIYHNRSLVNLRIYFVASFPIDLHLKVYLTVWVINHSLQHVRSLFSLKLPKCCKVAVSVFQFVCA